MGFFDGACQGTLGYCGARRIFLICENHFNSFKYVVGSRKNNKIHEICDIWFLMKIEIDGRIKIPGSTQNGSWNGPMVEATLKSYTSKSWEKFSR